MKDDRENSAEIARIRSRLAPLDIERGKLAAALARNRYALNESLKRSYEELARGENDRRLIEEIIADGRRRFRRAP